MWKDICGFEGLYQVSDNGAVLSCDRITADGKHLATRLLKSANCSSGYKFVCLRKDGRTHNRMIHRLVAEAFIPNTNNFPEVNHKDGNKLNNSVENLEWCTRSDNLKHALKIGLMESQCKIIRKVTVTHTSGYHREFPSMVECCKFFGRSKCWLCNYTQKHGNPCRYGKFTICVSERGTV